MEKTDNSSEEFPFKQCPNYKDLTEIITHFPHLSTINEYNTQTYDSIANAKCFIIRSNNDDDVHKAIKYGIWTSTQRNIDKLNEVFQESKSNKQEIFLFFSVVKSGQFEGVARMISHVQPINFPYWWQAGKWRSLIKIQWLFIKDIPYSKFTGIQNKDDYPITHSRDGSELNWLPHGKKMLDIFKNARNDKTILFDFQELDEREQMIRKKHQEGGYQQYQFQQKGGYSQQSQQQQQQYYQQMMMNGMSMFWQYQQMMAANYYNQMPMQQQQQQQQYQLQMGMPGMPMNQQQPYQQTNQMSDQAQPQQQLSQQQEEEAKQEEDPKQQ